MEVFVGNINYAATEESLGEFLESHCGGEDMVRSCTIKRKNGASKGFGFVIFRDREAAEKICELSQYGRLRFMGRPLKVRLKGNAETRVQETEKVKDITLYFGNLQRQNELKYIWRCEASAEFFYRKGRELSLLVKKGFKDYKMEFRFSSLYDVDLCLISRCQGIIFHLRALPLVYESQSSLPSILSMLHINTTESRYSSEENWIRTVDFTEHKVLGQSLVVCLEFPASNAEEYRTIVRNLRNYNFQCSEQKELCLSEGCPYASLQKAVPILQAPQNLPYETEYLLNYLVQDGYISPVGLTNNFYSLLRSATPTQCHLSLEKFLKLSETCVDPVPTMQAYLNSMSRARSRSRLRDMPRAELENGQMYVRRLIITPSKVYCYLPEIELTNRVTRNYENLRENFLRVTFLDEEFNALASSSLSSATIYERFAGILNDGVLIGEKNFQFLAFSSSQLRESSVWMFAGCEGVTCDMIREWMGDFLSIRNVAKCAARMGQSFSSSTHTAYVHENEVQHIDDVLRQQVLSDGSCVKYCFSDGIGKISASFAKVISRKLSLATTPSAFQIRYGGYKGVVAVDPYSTAKLSLRPSMRKFHSTQTGLDVLSWSKFIPCYLNRQVVMLLSTLGIADEIFERMQEAMVARLDFMMQDALTALELVQGGQMSEMLKAGYAPDKEPYLKRLLKAFRAAQIHLLRTRARIFVPQGRCLIGCMDENGILEYGQVFIQVSPNQENQDRLVHGRGARRQNDAILIQGRVVVAKNPCLHPGDVRVLNAVDVPELHHMVDCVVFPRKGSRPHPNECSGSDLDGDLYFVTWDQQLVPISADEPMSYEASPPKEVDHPVTLQEIQKFFLDYMLNDSLGVISNAHLVLADQASEKARDKNCIELARLFSVAVDFPKTGVPAKIPDDLRPRKYPDFMEKEGKIVYESETVIGKLYRAVKDHKPLREESDGDIHREYDRDLMVTGFEDYLAEAQYYKSSYDDKLMGLMKRYGTTEAEIMSGHILSLSKYYKKTGEVKDRVKFAAEDLKREARSWFNDDEDEDEAEVYAKAYAWYHITYHPAYRCKKDPEDELLSFPWVNFEKLLKIKRRVRQRCTQYN